MPGDLTNPPPLNYETPSNSLAHSCLGQMLLGIAPIVGFVLGFAGVVFVGSLFIMDQHGNRPSRAEWIGGVALVFSIVIAGGLFATLHIPRSRREHSVGEVARRFAIGLLLGSGIACLLEGFALR